MIRKVLIVVLCIVALVVGYAAIKDPNYRVSRNVIMSASPNKIFPYLNNSEKMNAWMPWKDMDQSVEMTYSGPTEGKGSTSSWVSKGQMGDGQAVIIESVPNSRIVTEITYTRPMSMVQTSEMTLAPTNDGQTVVTWSVSGKNGFVGRLFCLFADMDKMVGTEFEKGLNKLKSMVEEN